MEEIEQLLNEQMQIELTSEGKEIEEKFKNIEEEIFNLLETKEGNERIMRKIDEMEFPKKVTFKEPSNEEELLLQIAEGITKLNENMIMK
ncbi:6839_t:CDS:2 [Rhizophagus irregularis]|nr:6839_t:CDS:2 [Rhizophagus irregularis]